MSVVGNAFEQVAHDPAGSHCHETTIIGLNRSTNLVAQKNGSCLPQVNVEE
jgi:hypothetical protein